MANVPEGIKEQLPEKPKRQTDQCNRNNKAPIIMSLQFWFITGWDDSQGGNYHRDTKGDCIRLGNCYDCEKAGKYPADDKHD